MWQCLGQAHWLRALPCSTYVSTTLFPQRLPAFGIHSKRQLANFVSIKRFSARKSLIHNAAEKIISYLALYWKM